VTLLALRPGLEVAIPLAAILALVAAFVLSRPS
jgi:hypothetical protein